MPISLESEHQAGFLEKTAEKGNTLLKKLEQKTGISPVSQSQLGGFETGRAYYDYRSDLKTITSSTATQEKAFLTLTEIFKPDR